MSKIIISTLEELNSMLDSKFSTYLNKFTEAVNSKIDPPKLKVTVKETAEILNVTELTVRNYIAKGFIKAEKIGRRVLINRHSLDNALSEVKSLKYRRL